MENTVKERLTKYLKYKNISKIDFGNSIGVSAAYVSSIRKSIQPDKIKSIALNYPDLNIDWLLTGEGNMIKRETHFDAKEFDNNDKFTVSLLPVSAQGGSLNDFVASVDFDECESIISPVKDIDFAIRVAGDSMYPEYPSGTIILIKKIDETLFIEWGKTYVLDTCNGIVVKEIHKGDNDDEIKCVSINKDPKFCPFSIKLKDIFGMYRVVMSLSLK